MVGCVLVVIIMLIGVAYLIVAERKGLGMVQLRQGPNKVGLKGLAQPVADGVKLFIKEVSFTHSTNYVKFMAGPLVLFFLSLCFWALNPSGWSYLRVEYGALIFFCISSCSVYGIFMCGWACNSRYGMLGAMRAVAQVISYEVVMSVVLFCPLLFMGSYDLLCSRESGFFNWVYFNEVFVLWFIIILAELNRTPFDFVEGESELVAGYSVEYGGGGFALIALSEYNSIFFISLLSSSVFFSVGNVSGGLILGDFLVALCAVLISYLIIVVRGALPRYRYDLLMVLCWCSLLPLSLCLLSFHVVFC